MDTIPSALYDIPHLKANIKELTNKKIYEALTFNETVVPSAENKWVEYYPFLGKINWCVIYSLCHTVTTNSKLRSLQYSIVHRIFCCNYNLYLWKITESSVCWYCNQVDTLEHYFFYCDQSRDIWKEVEKIVQSALKLKINFTVLEILLGIPCSKYTTHHTLNLLMLFTKQFIYSQKNRGDAMFPTLLFRNLKRKCEIEIFLLKSNPSTSSNYLEDWERVQTHIMSLV